MEQFWYASSSSLFPESVAGLAAVTKVMHILGARLHWLAAKEVIFIRELLIDLGFIIDAASVIKCNSKSATPSPPSAWP